MAGVGGAYAAAYGAAFAQRVAYAEAHHGILARAALRELAEELAHYLERVAAVEVVAVDDGKGFLNDVLAHHHGMVRAPRLFAAFGHSEALGQFVQRLEHHFHRQVVLILADNLLAEIVLKILADDKHQFAETGLDGIVDGIVHNRFAVGAQTVHLLQTTIAAAHAGSKQKQCRFHTVLLISISFYSFYLITSTTWL